MGMLATCAPCFTCFIGIPFVRAPILVGCTAAHARNTPYIFAGHGCKTPPLGALGAASIAATTVAAKIIIFFIASTMKIFIIIAFVIVAGLGAVTFIIPIVIKVAVVIVITIFPPYFIFPL
jgi:hypothetical protein